jgi:hypothetical protein
MAWKLRRRGPAWPSRRRSRPRPGTARTRRGRGSWQSASLPGRSPPSRADLRRASSRALRAASRAGGVDGLADDGLGDRGVLLQEGRQRSLTMPSTRPLTSVLPSLVLVWPSNCGSGMLARRDAVRPSRTSSPEMLSLSSLRRPLLGVGVDDAGQGGLEAGEVGAALDRVDVVGEGEDGLGVGRGPLQARSTSICSRSFAEMTMTGSLCREVRASLRCSRTRAQAASRSGRSPRAPRRARRRCGCDARVEEGQLAQAPGQHVVGSPRSR